MKILSKLLLAIVVITAISCEEPVDTASLINFPPSILSVQPTISNGKVPKVTFTQLKVMVMDGQTSPLVSGSMTLKDADGEVLYTVNQDLSGTLDSIQVAVEEFDPSTLDYGTYRIEISITDRDNQVTVYNADFDLVSSLYAANNEEMYVAGEFNGWSYDAMVLVADYTWEVREIDLEGGEWKFKNTVDWTDKDWGDPTCGGSAVEFGANINCGFSGLVNVRFNDQTLEYTVEPAISFEGNVSALYLLGSFNQFQGSEAQFTQVADNSWELAEIRLKAGDAFRFAESPYLEGKNYGDNELDGIAEEFGANIVLDDSYDDAFYKVLFNDKTRAYSVEFVRPALAAFLVGGSTSAGWNPGASIPFVQTGVGTFEIFAYFTVAGDGFKILPQQDWAGDYGKGADGELLQEGESNITVPNDGFYRVTLDFNNLTYTLTAISWAIIGDATPNGWNDPDTDMTFDSGYTWSISNVTLTTGELKFRANDGWDINFGDNGADGSLEYGGSNIPVSAGTYTVVLTLDPVNGYSYSIQ